MLNEIREYEQYTAPLDTLKEPAARRLKYLTLIKSHLGGLERAMTIIARWFIFKDNDTVENFNEATIIEILKAWCGFQSKNDISEAEHLKDWLPKYIRQVLLGEALQKQETNRIKLINTWLEKLNNRNKEFSKSMYPDNFKSENSYKAITYERIIANAFLEGKLEMYYLLCETDPLESECIRKNTTTNVKMKEPDYDLLLKATAYYLLQKRDNGQEYAFFNQSDFANWLLVKADPKNFELEKYLLTATGEPLFSKTTIGHNTTKIKIHPKWMEKFRLVKAADIDNPENRGRIFYSDPGCSNFLQRNVNY